MATVKREQIVAMNQHYQNYSLDYFLDCQQRLGCSRIELWCGAGHFWLDSAGHGDCAALKKKLNARSLEVVSVTSPSCAYQYQYAAVRPYHMERARAYFKNGIDAAHELEAPIAVVNSGWGYLGENPDDMWARAAENLHALAEYARTRGVVLVMESLRDDESNIVNSLQSALRMFREVDHPNLKVMADTIAVWAAGETLEAWFEVFGDNLVHMHFLDGDPHVHNAWGDGNTPLERQLEILEQNGYTGYLVQEIADERYFSNPFDADQRNMRVLERFF